MKRIIVAMATAGVMLAADGATAGKVNMPKEGSYEFDFCTVVRGKTLSAGDKVFVFNYEGISNLTTVPPGRPFDRMGSVCYGTYANLNGHQQESGVCELTDQDADKWWMDYHGNAEGTGGTYTAVHGTGKYEGMTLKGEYRLDSWPVALKDVGFQGCNHNKGTYKLK